MTEADFGFTQSLWSATAEAASKTAVLSGDVETDVVIVGAGFTGLSAALHIAEQALSVVSSSLVLRLSWRNYRVSHTS